MTRKNLGSTSASFSTCACARISEHAQLLVSTLNNVASKGQNAQFMVINAFVNGPRREET